MYLNWSSLMNVLELVELLNVFELVEFNVLELVEFIECI